MVTVEINIELPKGRVINRPKWTFKKGWGAVYMDGGISYHQEDPKRRIILAPYVFFTQISCKKLYLSLASGGSREGARGAQPDLIFRPNWGLKGFGYRASPLSQGLDDRPPSYFKVWIRYYYSYYLHCTSWKVALGGCYSTRKILVQCKLLSLGRSQC